MQNGTATFDSLTKDGWHVKDEVKDRLVEEARARNKSLAELLLATDLRKIGKPFLPDGLNHADSTTLKGPNVLQILTAEDVSKPSKGVGTSSQRLMRLKLTDSKLTCIAAEFKPVPQLSEDLPPGTKVCCTNASVKLGVLLLDAKSVQVLGGQVEELLEAWTFQRKFGNVQRPAGAADDTEQPPAFQSFIPGRRHNQAGHRPPQQQAIYPMTSQQATAPAATVAGKGMPDQASLGTAGKTHQPPSGLPPPGFRAPPGLQPHLHANQAGTSQTAAASSSSAATETTGSEGPEAKQGQQAQQQRRPQEPKGQMQHNQAAVKHKLLDRLADEGPSGRGHGRGRGRRGRRGHDDEEEAGMTLEEYEALQQRPKVPFTLPSSKHPAELESQLDQDEVLARQLQQQMDLEDQHQQQQPFQHQQMHQQPHAGTGGPATFSTPGTDVARDLARSLFAFDRQEDEGAQYGRGRGRGRGRGGRRGGRSRG